MAPGRPSDRLQVAACCVMASMMCACFAACTLLIFARPKRLAVARVPEQVGPELPTGQPADLKRMHNYGCARPHNFPSAEHGVVAAGRPWLHHVGVHGGTALAPTAPAPLKVFRVEALHSNGSVGAEQAAQAAVQSWQQVPPLRAQSDTLLPAAARASCPSWPAPESRAGHLHARGRDGVPARAARLHARPGP